MKLEELIYEMVENIAEKHANILWAKLLKRLDAHLKKDTLLTTQQVADMFHVKPPVILAMANSGELPCVESIGKGKLFRESAVWKYIEKNETKLRRAG